MFVVTLSLRASTREFFSYVFFRGQLLVIPVRNNEQYRSSSRLHQRCNLALR